MKSVMYLNNKQQIIELILNTGYFIPLGYLYRIRAGKLEVAVITMITILWTETLQYVFYLGIFDIWDIISNFIGCVIGYQFYRIIKRQMA
ncbi:VanZ family protein [Enterococcus sp. AZ007]|uniref:VanZ family protein n=1 Tax=Enterococcus sp. AZ007 TaxID=2774839 RepID=UPI003F224E77